MMGAPHLAATMVSTYNHTWCQNPNVCHLKIMLTLTELTKRLRYKKTADMNTVLPNIK